MTTKKLAFGAGHIAFEAALADALGIADNVCIIAGLTAPIVVYLVQDKLTSADLTAQRVFLALSARTTIGNHCRIGNSSCA